MINYSVNETQPAAERPIVVFDSGVGGLPYLELAINKLPGEYFYYVADTENFPYGEKDTVTLQKIIVDLIGRIIEKWQPKCIVIACNTATVAALSLLREKYPVPFIGVVPAVKPAAAESSRKKFGVLATRQTTKNNYVSKLIDNFAPQCDVILLPASHLVDIVEEQFFTLSSAAKIREIRQVTEKMPLEEIDSIVLACTHYIHLEEEFKAVLGSHIHLIDSRGGVIRQLIRVLAQKQICADHKSGANTLFLSSIKIAHIEQYRLFAEKYQLVFGGKL